MQRLLLVLLTLTLCACQTPPQAAAPQEQAAAEPDGLFVPENIVDLTHAFGPETIYWPTDEQGFELDVVFAGDTEQGYYYSANAICSAEHGGTHLDAPIHFWKGGDDAAQIPVERLVGPGVVIDVREKVAEDRDYLIGVADFEAWEASNGPLPEGAIVLLRTGFSEHWPDREKYLGTAKLGPEAIPELHFPGLHPDAATWIKDERSIDAIGIDTPSIDYGQSTGFESHVALFSGGIPAFENVAHLENLPENEFLVVALPMKISGGSGGPLRIVAMW